MRRRGHFGHRDGRRLGSRCWHGVGRRFRLRVRLRLGGRFGLGRGSHERLLIDGRCRRWRRRGGGDGSRGGCLEGGACLGLEGTDLFAMFAELSVEKLDLSDLHLVQIDLHLAREVESAAKERHGIDLHAADAVHQLGQFVDMLDQLIQSFLVAHKCIVEGGYINVCMP